MDPHKVQEILEVSEDDAIVPETTDREERTPSGMSDVMLSSKYE